MKNKRVPSLMSIMLLGLISFDMSASCKKDGTPAWDYNAPESCDVGNICVHSFSQQGPLVVSTSSCQSADLCQYMPDNCTIGSFCRMGWTCASKGEGASKTCQCQGDQSEEFANLVAKNAISSEQKNAYAYENAGDRFDTGIACNTVDDCTVERMKEAIDQQKRTQAAQEVAEENQQAEEAAQQEVAQTSPELAQSAGVGDGDLETWLAKTIQEKGVPQECVSVINQIVGSTTSGMISMLEQGQALPSDDEVKSMINGMNDVSSGCKASTIEIYLATQHYATTIIKAAQ